MSSVSRFKKGQIAVLLMLVMFTLLGATRTGGGYRAAVFAVGNRAEGG